MRGESLPTPSIVSCSSSVVTKMDKKTLNIFFAAVYGVGEIGQQAHLDCSNISLKLIG
jgi:hypothetical protein